MKLTNGQIEKSFKAGFGFGDFTTHRLTDGSQWIKGTVQTPFGFVLVCAQEDFWNLRMIGPDSYVYEQGATTKSLTPQNVLTRKATRFARKIWGTEVKAI